MWGRPGFFLAVKFITRRVVNVEAVARTFKPLWKADKGISMKDMGENTPSFGKGVVKWAMDLWQICHSIQTSGRRCSYGNDHVLQCPHLGSTAWPPSSAPVPWGGNGYGLSHRSGNPLHLWGRWEEWWKQTKNQSLPRYYSTSMPRTSSKIGQRQFGLGFFQVWKTRKLLLPMWATHPWGQRLLGDHKMPQWWKCCSCPIWSVVMSGTEKNPKEKLGHGGGSSKSFPMPTPDRQIHSGYTRGGDANEKIFWAWSLWYGNRGESENWFVWPKNHAYKWPKFRWEITWNW